MNHSADSNQISSSFSDELDSDFLQTSSRSESDGNEVLLKSLEETWFQPEPLLTGNHRSAEFPLECLPSTIQDVVIET
ncbi:uncharacterized protein METZ01_LOCUS319962 [marine metagenome]|uniref:Uncharacterized protein n=1 Tax=marine metagenome TaxID=408172 RepID=A0A382P2X7_9ZZZZ